MFTFRVSCVKLSVGFVTLSREWVPGLTCLVLMCLSLMPRIEHEVPVKTMVAMPSFLCVTAYSVRTAHTVALLLTSVSIG